MQNHRNSISQALSTILKVISETDYYLTAVCVVALSIALLMKDVTGVGADLVLYCNAGITLANGGNPYLASDIGGISWNYLPVYAGGFDLLCNHLGFGKTYIIWYVVFFLSGMALWIRERSWLYGIALCSTGLYSLGWTIKTGNVSAIEFFFISLAVYLLIKKKFGLSLFVLGTVSSIKLLPILYLPLFLDMIPDWKLKVRSVAFGVTGFLIPFLVSIVQYPTLMVWYFEQISGAIPDQHSAIAESGGVNTPSLASMFVKLFSIRVEPMQMVLLSFLLYVLAVITVFYAWKLSRLNSAVLARPEILMGFGMAFLTLFMPRLKPYGYMPALLSFYLLTKENKKLIQSLFLWILSVIPLGMYYVTQHSIYFKIPVWLPTTVNHAIFTLYEYYQTFILFISMGILFYILLKPRPENKVAYV